MTRKKKFSCHHCGKTHDTQFMAETCFDLDMKELTGQKTVSTEAGAKPAHSRLSDIKEYFTRHYGYISHELSDKELELFISRYIGYTTEKICDLLSDYLLSQGLADVQE